MLAHELRGTRLALNLSLAGFAKMLGVSQSHLWRMETGKRPIPPGLDAATEAVRALYLDRLHAQDRERILLARIEELEARATKAEARAAALDAWRESIEWLYLPREAEFKVMAFDLPPGVVIHRSASA